MPLSDSRALVAGVSDGVVVVVVVVRVPSLPRSANASSVVVRVYVCTCGKERERVSSSVKQYALEGGAGCVFCFERVEEREGHQLSWWWHSVAAPPFFLSVHYAPLRCSPSSNKRATQKRWTVILESLQGKCLKESSLRCWTCVGAKPHGEVDEGTYARGRDGL